MHGQTVTILVTALAGPSPAGRDTDGPAAVARRAHVALARRAVAEHGGREVRTTGHGLVAAFPSAAGAVRCAVALQRAAGAAGEAGLRLGLDAGEPLEDGGDLYGTAVTVAERLCDAADAGEVLVSGVVARIAGPRLEEPVQPVGALRLRGLGERIAAARVAWREDEGAAEPRLEAPAADRLIRAVVADDQRLVRAGFRVILDDEPDITVVGEAADGRAAVDVVVRTRPDVVLMDVRMPELDGLGAAERILRDPALRTAVLMLTTFDRDEYVYRALRIGASGFLLKDAPADRLVDAVRVAAGGDALLAPSVTRRLVAEFARTAPRAPGGVPGALAELTERELDVLRAVARGLSNAEIAREFTLGENTVKTHVAHVLRKLGLRDRVQAVVVAYETGLVTPAGEGGAHAHPRG